MAEDARVWLELPRYKSHKEVRAAKIHSTSTSNGEDYYLHFEGEDFEPVHVTKEWMVKRGCDPGGYYVVYEDGYASWSPAKAFEEGYTAIS